MTTKFLNYKIKRYPYFEHYLTWNRLLATLFCLLTFPVVIFTFYDINSAGIWFDSFQYLTIQGNLLFWVFLFLYAFSNNRRIFNNNYFLICVLAYITFVFIGFNTLLLPSMVLNSEFVSGYDWTSTVWYHMFSPILDISFGVTIFVKINHGMPKFKIVGYGMIYVAYQFVYFVTLPFASASIRYSNKVNAYDYLGLTVTNKELGSCSHFLTLDGKGHNIIGVANQILNNFSGVERTKLAEAMITHWFSYGGKTFVSYSNNTLVLTNLPNSVQLAHIYSNLGLNTDAIQTINANGVTYFHDYQFSVYGEVTNLNPDVNIYAITSVNNHSTIEKLYAALTSSNWTPSSTDNLYVDTHGSYAVFGIVFGAIIAYLLFLCFWCAICIYTQKKNNQKI